MMTECLKTAYRAHTSRKRMTTPELSTVYSYYVVKNMQIA